MEGVLEGCSGSWTSRLLRRPPHQGTMHCCPHPPPATLSASLVHPCRRLQTLEGGARMQKTCTAALQILDLQCDAAPSHAQQDAKPGRPRASGHRAMLVPSNLVAYRSCTMLKWAMSQARAWPCGSPTVQKSTSENSISFEKGLYRRTLPASCHRVCRRSLHHRLR